MILTRLDTSATVSLPDDLHWQDEFNWNQVVQEESYTLTGALVVESFQRLAGRPLTLVSYRDEVWVPRATVETLAAWAAVPGLQMTLAWRGATRNVMFRASSVAVESTPVVHIEAAEGTDPRLLTLRLLEV